MVGRKNFAWCRCIAAFLIVAVSVGQAFAQSPPIGERIFVDPEELPEPYATRSVANPPRRILWDEPPKLNAPPGFEVVLFATDLTHPRWMTVAEDGAVFLSESRAGQVLLLRDTDGDGLADERHVFLEGLSLPHGLDIHGSFLYVADLRAVYRVPIRTGDNTPQGALQRLIPEGLLGPSGSHWTRNVKVVDDGRKLFVAIGSRSNVSPEDIPSASIQQFDLDKTQRRTFARGLRNPVGMAVEPTTGDLYTTVVERDGLGDDLVPDYLTRARRGEHYGWPYAYVGQNPQPRLAEKAPHIVERSKTPDLLFRSHSTPLGLVFYEGDQFPQEYRGDAFVALKGSWNSGQPRGYMVVRVPFEDGRPVGHYEPFVTGFWVSGQDRAEVIGRPTGLAITPSGDLLISDDSSKSIWRVRYVGSSEDSCRASSAAK